MSDLAAVVEAFHPIYRSIIEVGASSIGRQYTATTVSGRRSVLLTVLAPTFATALIVPSAFETLLDQVSRVSDQSLVPVIDAGIAPGGLAYYVTLPPRGILLQSSAPDGVLPFPLVTCIGNRLARSLALLHEAGFIHGWVHRGLVFLHGEDPQLLGAAVPQALIAGGVPADLIVSSLLLPQYRISEFRQMSDFHSPQWDIYTLGVLLYELSTGKPPFGGRVTSATMVTVLSDASIDFDTQGVISAQSLAYPILRAIEKTPTDRWPSATAFANALRDTLSDSIQTVSKDRPATLRNTYFFGLALVLLATALIFHEAVGKLFHR